MPKPRSSRQGGSVAVAMAPAPPAASPSAKQVGDRVNHLNSGLMVVSCVAAFFAPVELFLFSYGVLGPLHYLTEISWLHDRGYFSKQRWDGPLLAGLCLLVSAMFLTETGNSQTLATMTAVAFGGAAVLTFVKDITARIVLITLVVMVAMVAAPSSAFGAMFGILLTTIIHVLVFTAAFVLLGALRARSVSGIASLVVFTACTAACLFYVPATAPAPLSDYVFDSYRSFAQVNVQMLSLFGMTDGDGSVDVFGETGFRVMRLIAFAYTYHYLNWFSKTSVIRWHEVPRARFVAVVALWLASLAVYAWDYRTGLLVLFFLSLAHVYLEFPLNFQSFVGIGRELGALARGFSGGDAAVPGAARARADGRRA